MYQPRNMNKCGSKFSPDASKWKLNLRERCKRRIKEERTNLYNSYRNIPNKEELKTFVMETVQGQWNELKYSDQMEYSPSIEYHHQEFDEKMLLEELEEELLSHEKAKLEEYLLRLSREEDEYGRYLEELQEELMCPLCSENKLFVCYGSDGMNQISCSGNCAFSKKVPYGLTDIRMRLDTAMKAHSNCLSVPGFTFTKEDSCLYLICADCSTIYFVL
ncbi:RPA-interacting protein-like [Hetaerina americana]|uniref:RPA-interacting protein-like n=1 Tax=Hetaerina americana TaxID=62018 RepID=UPI003A7F57A0